MNLNKFTLPIIASGLIISRSMYIDPVMVYNRVSSSIVSVKSINYAQDPFNPKKTINKVSSIGTGFVYKDYIITNAHVLKDSDEITIQDQKVNIIDIDQEHDIAILEKNNKKLKSLKKCDSSPKVGESVLAIGNPFNLDNTMTSGIISGINRNIDQNQEIPLFNLIQTDAAINPGNSGGPLINVNNSCVIGVNTAILSPSGGNIGIGFAIDINLVDDIINHSLGRTKLGIVLLPDRFADSLNTKGVIISDIIPDSIADNLNLRPTQRVNEIPVIGDVIIGINDEEINNSLDLMRILDKNEEINSIKIRNIDGIFEYKLIQNII
jgi:S1-C subfamily serine protease